MEKVILLPILFGCVQVITVVEKKKNFLLKSPINHTSNTFVIIQAIN